MRTFFFIHLVRYWLGYNIEHTFSIWKCLSRTRERKKSFCQSDTIFHRYGRMEILVLPIKLYVKVVLRADQFLWYSGINKIYKTKGNAYWTNKFQIRCRYYRNQSTQSGPQLDLHNLKNFQFNFGWRHLNWKLQRTYRHRVIPLAKN